VAYIDRIVCWAFVEGRNEGRN